MKDFKAEWKKMLGINKQRSSADMFQYQLLKAQTAKTPASYEVRVALAGLLLQRAFTPITNQNKLTHGQGAYSGLKNAQWGSRFKAGNTYNDLRNCLETEEEQALYQRLWEAATKKLEHKTEEFYTYLFVRKDLSPAQMIVQSNHASIVLGASLKDTKPAELNLVLCGAHDERHLESIKRHFAENNCEIVEFREPDIGNQLTAIASQPLPYSQKGFAVRYPTLRI